MKKSERKRGKRNRSFKLTFYTTPHLKKLKKNAQITSSESSQSGSIYTFSKTNSYKSKSIYRKKRNVLDTSSNISTKIESRNNTIESKKYVKKKIGFSEKGSFEIVFDKNLAYLKNFKQKIKNYQKRKDKNSFFKLFEENFLKIQSNLTIEELADMKFVLRIKENRIEKNFLKNNSLITGMYRCKVIHWMSEICHEFNFQRSTFHLSVYCLDSFLSKIKDFEPKKFQCLAMAAISLSSKFEEVVIQDLKTYLKKSCNIYTIEDLKDMEIKLLITLDYQIAIPNLNSILFFIIKKLDFYFTENKNHYNSKIANIKFNEEILFKIFLYLDFFLLDEKYVEFNPFKLSACLIFTIMMLYFDKTLTKQCFIRSCSSENNFLSKICSEPKNIQFNSYFNLFFEEMYIGSIESLFKYFKFISKFLEIKAKNDKFNCMKIVNGNINEARITQVPINNENKSLIEKIIGY